MSLHFPKWILSIVVSPYFLALPVTFLFLLLLPDIFQKYRAEIVQTGSVDKKDGFEYYSDLDHDGFSERLVLFNNTEGQAAIKIIGHDGFIIDQYYFQGQIIQDRNSLISGNFDRKGTIGVFLMITRNDSVFLNGIAPNGREKYLLRDQFIARTEKRNGRLDYNVSFYFLCDMNRDGVKEVIFGIMAGFPLQPRRLYIYDLVSGKLKQTPTFGTNLGITDTSDVNNDGYPELLAASYAVDNYPKDARIPYHDSCAWLMVFDRNLDFLFPPVPFRGRYWYLNARFMKRDSVSYIAGILTSRSAEKVKPRLLLFDIHGHKIASESLGDSLEPYFYEFCVPGNRKDQVLICRDKGRMELYNFNLKLINKKSIEGLKTVSFTLVDIDMDGEKELIFAGNGTDHLAILRSDLKEATYAAIPLNYGQNVFDIRQNGPLNPQIVLFQQERFYVIDYRQNQWWYFKFPVYGGVYVAILLFIFLIRLIQRRTLRQMYDAEKKISEMQLLLLKNQIDPHFTFNALNSISASILQERPEDANRSLVNLSRLMRTSVLQSDKLSWTLSEEIEFLQNYIGLIRDRRNRSFLFQIKVSSTIDLEMQVPRMITQIYTENAIRHGLKPMGKDGILIVRINQIRNNLILEIEDNGIGRKKAEATGTHGTGRGMSIIDQTIATFNRYNQKKIQTEIHDLEDEQGQPRGTLVRLIIPVGMKYRFYGE